MNPTLLARRLREAERLGVAMNPLTDGHPRLTELEAYAVQRANLEAQSGRRVGYKLGFTSEAMRRQMGVPSPNYGVLVEGMQAKESVELSGLIHPRVEPEIALIIGRALPGGATGEGIRSAVEHVCPAIEVVDSRFLDYRFRPEDNIADNSSAARFVLGKPVPIRDAPELTSIRATLRAGGAEVASGVGRDALGGPLYALAWLLKALNRTGGEGTLQAGSIILTGAYPTDKGSIFTAEFGGLGGVEVEFV